MKQVRLIFWLLILGFMGLVFFQNKEFFLANNSLHIDLWFEKYTIPEIPNGIFFLGCFLIGLLLAYFYQMPERFRSGKNIKQLNATVASLKAEAAIRSQPETAVAPHSPPQSKPPEAGDPPGESRDDAAKDAGAGLLPKDN